MFKESCTGNISFSLLFPILLTVEKQFLKCLPFQSFLLLVSMGYRHMWQSASLASWFSKPLRTISFDFILTEGKFQIGKGVHQGCILSPCLFNLNAEYIMRNAGLEEAQAGIKIVGRNINNLRYADDTTLMAEIEEELKASWWKWKRRVKKLA